MDLLKEAVKRTKKPSNTDDIQTEKGNTDDIIKAVRFADKISAKERPTRHFAELLRGSTDFETVRNVWAFVHYKIPYVADSMGFERIRLPNVAIHNAANFRNGGDCKSFAVLCCELLRELGIESKIRFISQNMIKKARHVYTVAIVKGQEIPCDAVYWIFNQNPMRTFTWDFDAAKPKRLAYGDIAKSINGFGGNFQSMTIF
jgi:transglutaminase-like putative cysteine protease